MRSFTKGKDYPLFRKIFNYLGQRGSLRYNYVRYDIIIDVCKGYSIIIEKLKGNNLLVSLHFTYEYGYKNWNMATMDDVAYLVTDDLYCIKCAVEKFENLAKHFVAEHMNNLKEMLKFQENFIKQRE